MVSDGFGVVSTLWVYAVTGVPPGQVSVSGSALSISFANSPPNGVQPGTTSTVNTNDARVLDAAWSNGVLWLSFNDACMPPGDSIPRSCLRLIQIVTSILTVYQDFDVGAVGTYFFYPALRIDSLGNLDVVFGFFLFL
jgi:hypothetical protein